MTNRQKEDKQLDKCKDCEDKSNINKKISTLIDNCIKNKHKVYLITDLHLWLRDEKNKPSCHKRSDFDTVIKNINDTVGEDDVLINLGDIVDGEFKDKSLLKDAIKSINCKNKILLLGNNDIFDKSFYTNECGFLYAEYGFVWNDVVFTHMPKKDHDNAMNIHGHIHGYANYWVPYNKMIDVAYYDGRKKPVELKWLMNKLSSYAKHIKESPEHFEEYFDLFNSVMNSYIEDQYHD